MTTTTTTESSKKKRKLDDEEDDLEEEEGGKAMVILLRSSSSKRNKSKMIKSTEIRQPETKKSKKDKGSGCKTLVPVLTTAIGSTSKNGEAGAKKELIRQIYSFPVDDYNNIERAFSHIIHLKIDCVDKQLSKVFFDVHKTIFATFNGSKGIMLTFTINNSPTKISYYAPKSKTIASSLYVCNSNYRDDITYKHIEETLKYARHKLNLIHSEHKTKYTVKFSVCKILRTNLNNNNN